MALNANTTTLSVALLPDRATKQQLLTRRAVIVDRLIPHCRARLEECKSKPMLRSQWAGILAYYENQLHRIDARLKSKAHNPRKAAA